MGVGSMRFVLLVLLFQTSEIACFGRSRERRGFRSLKKNKFSPSPSASPTATPTIAPTRQPTPSPTAAPTRKKDRNKNKDRDDDEDDDEEDDREPTRAPTRRPSTSPVTIPPTSRTEVPTADPTEEPTPSPTDEPTASPTEEPTPSPTDEPTDAPTSPPVSEIVTFPTGAPTTTATPTAMPTEAPTVSPTATPTESPTNAPVMAPVLLTARPTTQPTSSPTKSPTVEPTISPTLSPTTSSPTTSPSSSPTLSVSPTESPTANPTSSPTPAPTNSPTPSPTIDPESRVTLNEFSVLLTSLDDGVNVNQLQVTLEEYTKKHLLFYTLKKISLTLVEGDSVTNSKGVTGTSVRFSAMAIFDGELPNLADVRREQRFILGKTEDIQAAIDNNPSLAGVTVKDIRFERVKAEEAFKKSERMSTKTLVIVVGITLSITVLVLVIALLVFRRCKLKSKIQRPAGPLTVSDEGIGKPPPSVMTADGPQEEHAQGCASLVSRPVSLGLTETEISTSPKGNKTRPEVISIRQSDELDYDDDYLTMDEDLRMTAESSLYDLYK